LAAVKRLFGRDSKVLAHSLKEEVCGAKRLNGCRLWRHSSENKKPFRKKGL
jgi:hypothetical protein